MWKQLLLLMLLGYTKTTLAIDCFKCSSFRGSDPSCEDPFNRNVSASILHTPCMTAKKHRNGIYPATACIKIKGVINDSDLSTMIIRDCTLNSGLFTNETELTSVSQCGTFAYNNQSVHGCVQSCSTDACNG